MKFNRKVSTRVALAILLLGGAVAAWKITTTIPLLQIAARYRAKMYCSCRELTHQTHSFCESWTHNPQAPRILIPIRYSELNQITHTGLLVWQAQAHFDKTLQSCILDF